MAFRNLSMKGFNALSHIVIQIICAEPMGNDWHVEIEAIDVLIPLSNGTCSNNRHRHFILSTWLDMKWPTPGLVSVLC